MKRLEPNVNSPCLWRKIYWKNFKMFHLPKIQFQPLDGHFMDLLPYDFRVGVVITTWAFDLLKHEIQWQQGAVKVSCTNQSSVGVGDDKSIHAPAALHMQLQCCWRFNFTRFQPSQKSVCMSVFAGQEMLLWDTQHDTLLTAVLFAETCLPAFIIT